MSDHGTANELAELVERGEMGEDYFATGPDAPARWLNRPQPVAADAVAPLDDQPGRAAPVHERGGCVMSEPTYTLTLSIEAAQWLGEFLHDVLNDDFMGAYQREVVGPIPAEIAAAFDLSAETLELFDPPLDDEGEPLRPLRVVQ